MILSREPTSPWRDFGYRIMIGLAVVGLVTVAQAAFYASSPVILRVVGSDVYRDAMRLTALHEMTVISMKVEGPDAVISGAFKKRRCDFVRANYYTRDPGGVLYPAAAFKSLVLDPERNRVRPPSPEMQTFGPWRITSAIPDPTALVIYVTMRCPEGTYTQKLADAPWRNPPASNQ